MKRREVEMLTIGDIVQLQDHNRAYKKTNQIPCKVLEINFVKSKPTRTRIRIEPLEGYNWDKPKEFVFSKEVTNDNSRWYTAGHCDIIEKKAYKVKVRRHQGVH